MKAHKKTGRRALIALTAGLLVFWGCDALSASSVARWEPRSAPVPVIPVSVPAQAPYVDPAPSDRAAVRIRSGIASTYGDGYEGYLALPEGPGHRVRVCGPAACIIRTSNDAGPDRAMQRRGRIVDLDATDFNQVCGCDWRIVGTVWVTVEYLGSVPRELPATDTEGP